MALPGEDCQEIVLPALNSWDSRSRGRWECKIASLQFDWTIEEQLEFVDDNPPGEQGLYRIRAIQQP
jgi:hypothetical protein